MKARFLFPHKWSLIGAILFILGFVVAALNYHYLHRIEVMQGDTTFDINGALHDIAILLWIGGLFLVAFSKEKIEDEQIAQLRLDSLQWSIYFNYAILVLCILFIDRWHVMLGVAAHFIFTPLLFFIVRFKWAIYQLNRSLKNTD
ncbi:hypothetical protein LT679_11760 [Mucilaginibacter roseus]|uniref:Uncharacterized protein n=1 Tax=Mucilaginibacter roseus TaxID=1528868 RepID=A0ABS8U2B5_9SPHI|nr:hypothetical protein [Mucilaginibacter roseus]MCD8741280.1 hypothetical protein [Mucilaginibacter roseus]